jgi:hypothetical protein
MEDRGVVRKYWQQTENWLHNYLALLDKAAPQNTVVCYGKENGLIFIDFRYITGITANEHASQLFFSGNHRQVFEFWRSVIRFWINGVVETYPYVHWDWTSFNTIVTNTDNACCDFAMIDWEAVRVSNIHDIKERLVYKMQRELLPSAAIDAAIQHLDTRLQKYNKLTF